MKNKHHDVLVAWAEGRPIQFRPTGQGSWVTVETERLEQLTLSPYNPYNRELEWRVKPDLSWYRVALYGCVYGDLVTFVTGDTEEEAKMEKEKHFVRWLTDRISYEV
jgi:hypothetical protein